MFGLLVFVHEWGHLIFAKRAGMLAREFAIGFGPKIFSFYRNETLYTIRILPIGGYVRVAGEDPEIIELKPGHHIAIEFNEVGKVDKIIVNNKDKHPNAHLLEVSRVDLDHELIIEGYTPDELDELKRFEVDRKAFFVMDGMETQIAPYDRQFASKTVGQRAMQLFAGPMMNFILAILIFIIIGLVHGAPSNKPIIGDVLPDSPAEEAGLQIGDKVIEIDGEKVTKWDQFAQIIRQHPNETIEVHVEREDKIVSLQVTPKEVVESEITYVQIGVMSSQEKSLVSAISYGFSYTYQTTKLIIVSLAELITGQIPLDNLSGPVGIYDVTDQAVERGLTHYFMWMALLSVNLGVINLVPLPALDGGRLLFVGIEAVRGKPIDPQKEGIVHVIGFALLMLLMLVVTWNDIQRLFL